MVSILKRIRKSSLSGSLSSSAPRHEKLLEDSGPGEVDPIVEGVQFKVKYLGTCPVTSDSGEEVTANAIKAILATAKRLEKKLARVEVTVSLAGVTVREQEALQCLLDLPIDSISYCSADPTYDRVFAVLCTEGEGTACHAFLTHKRKMAQAATLTIAQAFNLAYEMWRNERPPTRLAVAATRGPIAKSVVVTEAVVEPRPSSPSTVGTSPSTVGTSPSLAMEDLLSSSPTTEVLFSSSPVPPPNSLASHYPNQHLLEDLQSLTVRQGRGQGGRRESQGQDEDLHAISLSRDVWVDGKRRGSSGGNSATWVQFEGEEEELVQKTTLERSRLFSLLSDFSSSPPSSSGWDSPLGTTPVKGTRLTLSCLASPVGSFSTPVGSPSSSSGILGSPSSTNGIIGSSSPSYAALGSPPYKTGFHTGQSPPSPTLLDWTKTQVASPPRGFSTLPEPTPRTVPPLSWPIS